jgi:hypothetical protein
MKKLLLFLSFLASQLFAEQCIEERYKPYFAKNNDRYIYSGSYVLGDTVFDKNSIIYDKENQTIKVWFISQVLVNHTAGIIKGYSEFDIKNNRSRILKEIYEKCNKEPILDFPKSSEIWEIIVPESINEINLNYLKKYLNIK